MKRRLFARALAHALARALVLGLAIGGAGAVSAPARAQEGAATGPVVIELFTSQGCSSCPPADTLMHKLAQRDDLIALSLHVDYWDYLGWKDAFALPSHTRRQQGYARRGGRDMIYTPQMVLNGQSDLVGVDAMRLGELVAHFQAQPPQARLVLDEPATARSVRLEPLSGLADAPLELTLVRYAPLREVRIERGENAGREGTYVNVVTGWQVLRQWDGTDPVQVDLPTVEGAAVLLLQHQGFGPIVAAQRLP